MPDGPLIIQSDHTLLLEVDHAGYADARNDLLGFAELVKSPEHVHTYRITPLSVWNARAAGHSADDMVTALEWHARFPPPGNVIRELREQAQRYGRLRLFKQVFADREAGVAEDLRLKVDTQELADQLASTKGLADHLNLRDDTDPTVFVLDPAGRGVVKQALIKAGYPAEDYAGYTGGAALDLKLRDTTKQRPDQPFALRPYQQDAVDAFAGAGGDEGMGGSGVIVLPCGAGKTVIGIAAMAAAGTATLILAPSTTAVRQWIAELLDKTTLEAHQVAEYSGSTKDIAPVTVATYQVLTSRKNKDAPLEHLALFDREDWGLIVYDEVHLLPAPVFAATATIQSRRRLGLTATLVREDGREEDVFALIGPKKADVPWKTLEGQGWIAKARCVEVRVEMPDDRMREYHAADRRSMFRIASENPAKATHSVAAPRRAGPGHRHVRRAAQSPCRPAGRAADRRQHRPEKTRPAFRELPSRRDPRLGRQQGRQLCRGPARRLAGRAGVGHLRKPTRRSPAAGPAAAPQSPQRRRGARPRSQSGPLLFVGLARHQRARVRP